MISALNVPPQPWEILRCLKKLEVRVAQRLTGFRQPMASASTTHDGDRTARWQADAVRRY